VEAREAPSWGVFSNVQLDEGCCCSSPNRRWSALQHYAFLVDDELFDRAYQRLADRRIENWADPFRERLHEVNHQHGGRGGYFLDPGGHGLELRTRPYP
jgi:hypothetical protein